MRSDNEIEHYQKYEEDEDEEFWELMALGLLIIIPIVLIYGLCIYCYKQRKMERKKFQATSAVLESRIENLETRNISHASASAPAFILTADTHTSVCSHCNSVIVRNFGGHNSREPPTYLDEMQRTPFTRILSKPN